MLKKEQKLPLKVKNIVENDSTQLIDEPELNLSKIGFKFDIPEKFMKILSCTFKEAIQYMPDSWKELSPRNN